MSAPAPTTPACPYAWREGAATSVFIQVGNSKFGLRDPQEAARHGLTNLAAYKSDGTGGQVHALNPGDAMTLLPLLT